jgi:predicted transcriptional regulator
MPRPAPDQPTEVELEILSFLWESGPATARDIHNALAKSRDTNYSTTVKMLAVMHEKDLVKRDESNRPIQFRAAATQKTTRAKMLKNLAQKAYDGSMGSLVLQALSSRKASAEELAEIREMLDQLQEKK